MVCLCRNWPRVELSVMHLILIFMRPELLLQKPPRTSTDFYIHEVSETLRKVRPLLSSFCLLVGRRISALPQSNQTLRRTQIRFTDDSRKVKQTSGFMVGKG